MRNRTLMFILIIFAVVIAAAIGVATWFVLRTRRRTKPEKTVKETAKEITKADRLPFRWSYILLPLIILCLSIALAAYFYPKLPAEVAIQLRFEETPQRLLSREMSIVMTLVPQALLIALAAGMTWGITKFGVLSRQTWSAKIKPETILWLMGNLLALPQGAFLFTMFNIFFYNSYQTQLMSTWLFLLIILGVPAALIGVFLVFVFFKVRQRAISQPEEPGSSNDG